MLIFPAVWLCKKAAKHMFGRCRASLLKLGPQCQKYNERKKKKDIQAGQYALNCKQTLCQWFATPLYLTCSNQLYTSGLVYNTDEVNKWQCTRHYIWKNSWQWKRAPHCFYYAEMSHSWYRTQQLTTTMPSRNYERTTENQKIKKRKQWRCIYDLWSGAS